MTIMKHFGAPHTINDPLQRRTKCGDRQPRTTGTLRELKKRHCSQVWPALNLNVINLKCVGPNFKLAPPRFYER